jgi:hypothetical protein
MLLEARLAGNLDLLDAPDLKLDRGSSVSGSMRTRSIWGMLQLQSSARSPPLRQPSSSCSTIAGWLMRRNSSSEKSGAIE